MIRIGVVITCLSWFAGLWPPAVHPASAEPAPATAERAAGDDDPPYRCKDHPGKVMVTLKADTDVKDLVAWVVGFTCKSFLLDPRIVATGRKVTVITPTPLTPREAYEVFLAALSTAGLTVVPRGKLLRIVDAQAARKEPLPMMKGGTPDDTDQFVRYVYKPSHAAADTLQRALAALKSEGGDVTALGPILMISDYASHVREMLAFARLVDVPGGSDGIYTLPVRHAEAGKLAEKLNLLLGTGGGSAAGPARAPDPGRLDPGKPDAAAAPSKIVVDERSNTLIIASSEAGYQRVKALVERLDIALEIEGGSAIYVYPLGSAVAEELAKTLTAAIGDGRGGKPPGAPPPGQPAPSPASAAPSGSLPAALDGQVRVIADPPTNSLIVMASAHDFLAVKDVIRQLDLPRREVYIEVVILEVETGDDSALGTSLHASQVTGDSATLLGSLQTGDVNTVGVLDSLQSAAAPFGGLAGLLGPSVPLLGKSIPSYAVLFQALAKQSRSNIVSSQSILAVDNVEAKYKVGSKRPVNMGNSVTPFGSTTIVQPRIEFPEYPLKLDLKPHISSDESVLLEVKHEAEQLTNPDGPISSTRSFETRVVVHDQETVVLSGLAQDKDSQATTKLPLLGDLPVLGYLFKTTKTTKVKSNLLILLTPYIIRDRHDLQAIRERRLREHDEFDRSMSALEQMAYHPNIDYRKKRGLIEEIHRAVDAVADDRAAREAIVHPPGVTAGSVDLPPAAGAP